MQWAFLPVKTAICFIDPSQPMLSPSRWLWSHSQLHFAPLCVTTPSPSSVRLRPSPHCLNLNPPVQLPGFCCNTHSNLSSFKSLHLQQLPPQGWEVQFLCKYLCPSRRFQELQLSPTSVQCSIKWTVYGNKLKMFTILYILYILKKYLLREQSVILYFRCLCKQLQLIFNKELKMNRKKKKRIW